MSVYTKCSRACVALMEKGDIFTEIDVVNDASKSARWSSAQYQEALRHANQVVGTQYRARKLARFGPVDVPGQPQQDYARIGSKIAYANSETGPEAFETPNGTFPRLMIEDDALTAQGRKFGTNRNDAKPWGEQEINRVETIDSRPRRARSPRAPRTELEANLREANKLVTDLRAEVERLRGGRSSGDGDIWGLVEDLTKRLELLEGREQARERVYQRGAAA